MVLIGRPINGISLNGNEYVCNSEGRTIRFKSVEDAKALLYNAGYTDDSIEAEGITIEEDLKLSKLKTPAYMAGKQLSEVCETR